jgi:glucosamine-6-phosphate deaminase
MALGRGLVLGADGGNSKTELLVVTHDGVVAAYVRGPGSNSHAVGAAGTAAVLGRLVVRAGLDEQADVGVFHLCGADVPSDVAELEQAVTSRGWVDRAVVDNDTFALLRVGTDAEDAVAIICGAGINCVGRAAGGRTARYPSLGWETGDWGGSEPFGREALHLAARGEDGRGEPTRLADAVVEHFDLSVAELGQAVHYKRVPEARLGELAPFVVRLATEGDAAAQGLVERLAEEVALLVRRAMRDLEVAEADAVLGGGMLGAGEGYLYERTLARLAELAPGHVRCRAPRRQCSAPRSPRSTRSLRRPGRTSGCGRPSTGSCRWSPMATELRRFPDPAQLGAALAAEILERYEASDGSYLLGCPGGRSLRSTYRALAGRRPTLNRLVIVMMDEYVGAPADAHFSCARFARDEVAGPLGIPPERVWLPDERDPGAYDARIEDAGGIDLFLLASGAGDGHVAFNPPGAARDGRTAVLRLARTTRRDNLATFPSFASLDEVPERGVSVGLGTISAARALRLVLHGADKRDAAARLLALDRFDPSWPASVVHDHADGQILADEEALA